jgi:hypothetical protein
MDEIQTHEIINMDELRIIKLTEIHYIPINKINNMDEIPNLIK